MIVTESKVAIQQEAKAVCANEATITIWFREVLRWLLLFPALHLFIHVTADGADKLTTGRAYIFAANHSSHLDAPAFLRALPLHLRLQVRIAAAADYFFTSRWKGALVSTLLNAFAFERKGAGCAASLAHAQQLLSNGHSVLIFPEGTRTKDGQLQHFKRGIGRLALVSAACVVPTWIEGTFAALPKGSHFPRHQKVVVRFGSPLYFVPNCDPAFIAAEVERQVRALAS